MRRWPLERWISLSAVVIAACALAFSLYEGRTQRRHERIQALPYVFLNTIYNENGVDFYVGNSGLGPGIVQWFEAKVDGVAQPSWASFVDALELNRSSYGFTVPRRGVLLRPGQESVILHIDSGPAAAKVVNSFERLDLGVCYCSLYGECWVVRGDAGVPERSDSCAPKPATVLSAG